MSKPLVIQMREAKANIIESVNNALQGGIPCFLLEPIIAEIHTQVSKSAQAEYEEAQRQLELEEKEKAERPAEEEAEGERGESDG